MKAKILIIIALFSLILILGYAYLNYDFRNNIIHQDSDFEISAAELVSVFSQNEANANSIYLGNIIEVHGNVEAIDTSEGDVNIYLGSPSEVGQVVCQLNRKFQPSTLDKMVGNSITIRGECTGMLLDVILVNSIIIQQ
ncbi:MAG: hypothetical protein HKN87_18870 [Saprospiraceae bacterium]|nr:hypothetical protein [Saprospiraceae bacterium]